MKKSELRRIIREELLKEDDKKIKKLAKSMAAEILDEIPYMAKEKFGDWPENVVGRDGSRLFYNTLDKELKKLIKKGNY